MTKLWLFLQQKRNREVLSWVGASVVAVAVGLWTAFVYIFPPKHEGGGHPGVVANCGVAVGGDVTSTTITAGPTNSDCSTKPEAKQ